MNGFCTNCGTQLTGAAKFCSACGYQADAEQSSDMNRSVKDKEKRNVILGVICGITTAALLFAAATWMIVY